MKIFLQRVFFFIFFFIVIIAVGVVLPVTPRAGKSLLFAYLHKDTLLKETENPRLIFIGGSNISFGLDSKTIESRLGLKVINTGVHAGIGLKYMIENTIQYIKKGDIVVLAAEYAHFYRDYNSVSEELLRTILDVAPRNYKLLHAEQIIKLIPFLPKYALSKFKPTEYIGFRESDIYSVNSFNEYGDVYAHWNMKKKHPLHPESRFEDAFNIDVMNNIKNAERIIHDKGGELLVTYPCYQDVSYKNNNKQIKKIADTFRQYNFTVLGYPERYKFPNDMMFNTVYHLNKRGVERRTELFIEDYLQYMANTKSVQKIVAKKCNKEVANGCENH